MKKTELVFILDRSGSMMGLEKDTIGGYNSMLERQKNAEQEVYVTTVLFDDKYELLHNRVNLKEVKPITEKEYYVRGCTALLDAVGKTVNLVKSSADADTSVIFVITTDGYENASREFNHAQIQRMIRMQEEKGWEFIFLGANIDSAQTAEKMGIRRERATDYVADSKGVGLNFQAISKAVSNFMSTGEVEDDWADECRAYADSKRG